MGAGTASGDQQLPAGLPSLLKRIEEVMQVHSVVTSCIIPEIARAIASLNRTT
jgi:hypothetical protein